VNQKCSLTLALVQESHDQQLERKPSSILHRQTTPKKKKKKKKKKQQQQQQQNGSSKHSAAAATAGFKQGQRRKQLHMTNCRKRWKRMGPVCLSLEIGNQGRDIE